jgi:hypothetical protein
MNANKVDPLTGVVQIGIWPVMNRDRRQDDWVVGWVDCYKGRRHPSIRVRNEDRDMAYAYFESLHEKDYDHSSPYIERADGASWDMRDKPVTVVHA